jgi:hypothetical protein
VTPFFIHSTNQLDENGSTALVLSVYVFQTDIAESHFDSELARELANGAVYDAINFVGFSENLSQVEKWLDSGGSVHERLTHGAKNFPRCIGFISFDESLGEYTTKNYKGEVDACGLYCDNERRQTLARLFVERGGKMKAPHGFHYSKPSRKHADTFLRASNVLEHFAATPILAFWLIRHAWHMQVDHILVDTSGISSVAYALAREIGVRKKMKNFPMVASHESYGGLAGLVIRNPSNTLLLVSATTSGGLKRELLTKRALDDQIVTLFCLGEKPDELGKMLCDLSRDKLNPNGFEPINSASEDNCHLCKNHSYPIQLNGDQFVFEPPVIQEVAAALEDFPIELREKVDRFAGIGLFRVHRNVCDRLAEISFDVGKLFERPDNISYQPTSKAVTDFQDRWQREILRGAPLNLRHIIYTEYPYSKELAEAALKHLKVVSEDLALEPVNGRELRGLAKKDGASALVISACIDDARELMGISLSLRNVQPRGNVAYVTPVFKSASDTERKRIKSNLTFGENKANTFSLFSLLDISLPASVEKDSWSRELDFLREFEGWLDKEGLERPQFLGARIELLLNASKDGMADQLYWPDKGGGELRVRSDFTLLNAEGGHRPLSQSDIYVAISCFLWALRNGVPKKSKLAYGPYARAVLQPETFQRFNDGVIQAAILRAVRGRELAYSNCEKEISLRMRNVILELMEPQGNGESLPEFVLAIGLRQLTMHPEHEQCALEEIVRNGVHPDAGLLARYILSLSAAGSAVRNNSMDIVK